MAFELKMDEDVSFSIDLIQKDRSRGLKNLQMLAEAGNQSAIVYLGLYLSEEPAAAAEAEKWLRRAAHFDSSDAAWNLAMMERERGNEAEMRVWIDRAAELGEPDALNVKRSNYNFDDFFAGLRKEI